MTMLLKICLGLLAVITLLFGSLWMALGLDVAVVVAGLSEDALPTGEARAILDSTIRFLAGVWLLTAIGLVIGIRHPQRHRVMLSIILVGLFVGGLGRVMSALMFGLPGPMVVPLATELLVPPVALLLLRLTQPMGDR